MHSGESLKELERIKGSVTRACAREKAFKGLIPVFGEGPCPCAVMIIGEAPGREETRLGRPFVGRAGSFFVSVLKEVFDKERDDFYITNVVKVWPKLPTRRLKTRPPIEKEIEFFLPFLREEIKIIRPKVILAVGRVAFSALVKEAPFSPGAWAEYDGIKVMPVYHPSYILRRRRSLDESLKGLKASLEMVKEEIGNKP